MEEKEIVIDIWGACVSRELFNFTDKFTVGKYIMQNPFHTLFKLPFVLDESNIKGTCGFTRRMANLEFNKKAIDYFQENFNIGGDNYLMIDVADARNDILEINEENVQISESTSTSKTLKELPENIVANIKRISILDIPINEWKMYIYNFCRLIKYKYKEDHIILHCFNFAFEYVDENNKIHNFDRLNIYKRKNELMKTLENIFKEYLPNCIVINDLKHTLSSTSHKLGLYPLHYCKEVYDTQNKMIEIKLGLDTEHSVEEIENEYQKFVDKLLKENENNETIEDK